jgi:uncharacterized surface protein with fasciclin (FAS1) repeats
MKNSFKKLASTIGALGVSLAITLPSLAQSPSGSSTGRDSTVESSPSNPSQATPIPGSGSEDPENQPNTGDQSNPGGIIAPANRPQAPGSLETPRNPQPVAPLPADRPVPPIAPSSPQGVVVPPSSSSQTLDAVVRQSPSFELFNALLRVADQNGALTAVLGGDSNYTIFAPTDTALAALPQGTFKALVQPENRDLLVRILESHIVRGRVLSNEVGAREIRSLAGESIVLTNSPVVSADIQTSNGIIHAISGVILPADVQSRLVSLIPQPTASGTSP